MGGLRLVGMQAIQHLVPEPNGGSTVGSSVIDQDMAVIDSQLIHTSQGPVRGGFDAQKSALGLRAVTRGHGDGHGPRQRQASPYRPCPESLCIRGSSSACFEQLAQLGFQEAEGLAAVAMLLLLRRRHLGEGAAGSSDFKDWVVAETLISPG